VCRDETEAVVYRHYTLYPCCLLDGIAVVYDA
jgi:hypothetical protein